MVLINNFLPLEGRVNCMFELVKLLQLDESGLTDKSMKIFHDIRSPKLPAPEISFEKVD
jgi:hypothetical protein